MNSFIKYCLRYFHLLTKFGQQAELLGYLHTKAGKKLPKKLDTTATSLLQEIQFRQGRIPHRKATITLQKIKAQKTRMEGNLHSVAGETMHQTRPEGRKDKIHTSQAGGHLAHRRQKDWEMKQEASLGAQADAVWRTKCSKRLVKGQLLHCRREGAGDSRHQGQLHTAESQTLQMLWNEVKFQATEQRIKNIFYRPISPTITTCAGQRGHCAGKEKLKNQQKELDSETRATCTLQKMERACMAEHS